jgi:TPR repeat protein
VERGIHVTRREQYERAAAAGDAGAMHDLGYLLERSDPSDLAEVWQWYERAAVAGHRCAMNDLGRLAERADPPDLRTAREWYERAAAAGETDAYFRLGYLLAERIDPPDLRAAREWYEKAAEHGSATAMYNLGQLHSYQLEPQDLAAARRWYERAAADGHPDAPFVLGVLSAAAADPAAAVIWYEKAVAAGHSGAMNNLGTVLEDKLAPPNLPAAMEWYERAAAAGNSNAKTNLARLRGTATATGPAPPDVPRTVLPDRVSRSAGSPVSVGAAPGTSAGAAAALDTLIDDTAYRHNPFRLAGLRTDADSRQLRKRVTELDAGAKLGAPLAHAGVLPVTPAPDPADVKAALNQLREPVHRLVQELFWIWPADGADPAMDALAGGDVGGAERIWLDRLDQDAIAAHNLAVLRHVQGLETPRGRAPETWLDALTAWDAAIGGAALWQRLHARAAHIDDRRLGEPALAELRRALPAALLRIHTTLIVRAAEDGDATTAGIHVDVLEQFAEQVARHPSAFDAGVIDDARGSAVRKLAAWLKTIADDAGRALAQRPREASAAAHRMLDRARVSLQVADRLRPPPDPVGAGAHDDLVRTAIACDDAHYHETKDAAASAALLERLGPIATTEAARQRLVTERATTARLYINELLNDARRATEGSAGDGARAARELLDRAQMPLARIRAACDPGDERFAEWQDMVALTATSCTVAYFNGTSDLDTAERLLARIRPLPQGREALDFVREQDAVLGRIRQQRTETARLENTCWFCGTRPAVAGGHFRIGLHRDVTYTGNVKRWKSLKVDVPRCALCVEEHRPHERKRAVAERVGALAGVAALITFLIGLGAHPVLIAAAICLAVALGSGFSLLAIGNEVFDRALRFPPVAELMAQGWKKGERPA